MGKPRFRMHKDGRITFTLQDIIDYGADRYAAAIRASGTAGMWHYDRFRDVMFYLPA